MDNMTKGFRFIGTGRGADLDARLSDINPWGGSLGPWRPGEGRPAVEDETAREHPAGYRAGSDLVDAVNTALILGKPLLVTGNPGTGKTQLAERVAWEFNLGPVLRFEAQSLSEANDLFYRFDLVGHVAASHTARPAAAGDPPSADARQFIDFGVLGKAILRTDPGNPNHADLFGLAFPEPTVARNASPSVVLIDEIDKASRDFPNDLLNGIERLEFSLKELRNRPVRVADDPGMKPIVVVTSNSERELPAPFLRRCVYCHIPDPDERELREIVRVRVFPETLAGGGQTGLGKAGAPLPRLFEDLLGAFLLRRQSDQASAYPIGPSELINWSQAVRRDVGDAAASGGIREHGAAVKRALGAFVKHRDDRQPVLDLLARQFNLA